MKRNGFTLIELLVVVAIIGILAAVGTVAYNGYTKAAKINAAKFNLKNYSKYVQAELYKCDLGEEYIFKTDGVDPWFTCSWSPWQKGGNISGTYLQNFFKKDYPNPFYPNESAFANGAGGNCPSDQKVGQIYSDRAYKNGNLIIRMNVKFSDDLDPSRKYEYNEDCFTDESVYFTVDIDIP